MKVMLAAAALVFLSTADSWAQPPRARELCGVIQAIDLQTHTLTIQPPKRDQPFAAICKHDTKFIRNRKFTEAAAIKGGLRGFVYYRSPLFGKPFVTKVVWNNTPTDHER